MVFQVKSAAFQAHEAIPAENTCDGKDFSPALSWSNIPKGTQSLALIMDDPDAPAGTWVHWVVYDLPADALGLDQGAPRQEFLPNGAKQGLCWGTDKFDRLGYYGPCPPPGKAHRYFFKLYALDKKLGLPAKKTKAELLEAMEGHILGRTELVGTYKH